MSRKKTGLQLTREPCEQVAWMATDLAEPKTNERSEEAHRNILGSPVGQCMSAYEPVNTYNSRRPFFCFYPLLLLDVDFHISNWRAKQKDSKIKNYFGLDPAKSQVDTDVFVTYESTPPFTGDIVSWKQVYKKKYIKQRIRRVYSAVIVTKNFWARKF